MSHSAITVNQVTVTYRNGHTALRDATFQVPGGSIAALVGVNGSGKSTLFKALMGFVRLAQGEISILQLPVNKALKQNLIAYVPQSEEVDWSFPVLVEDVVMMGRFGHMGWLRRPKQIDHACVDAALARVDMLDYRHRQIGELSGGQKKRAEESGVTLIYTPFAREAFVFIVNADNPVNSLTEQQVRDIFSGAITNWRTVGGNDQEIQTWQRPEDSGSQTVMQSQVMKNVRMISPQETEVASMMEGMIKVVAEYRNTNNAIGYTFRYYATQMNDDKNIKLLAINGIAPTAENIRNGKYPYIVDAFMVTRENTTSETQKLLEWFLTPQGQSLVEDVGYVPMYKTLP